MIARSLTHSLTHSLHPCVLPQVSDIRAIAERVKARGNCILVVDNTFMSSYFQRPLELGADIEFASVTKYYNGTRTDEEKTVKILIAYCGASVPSVLLCTLYMLCTLFTLITLWTLPTVYILCARCTLCTLFSMYDTCSPCSAYSLYLLPPLFYVPSVLSLLCVPEILSVPKDPNRGHSFIHTEGKPGFPYRVILDRPSDIKSAFLSLLFRSQ